MNEQENLTDETPVTGIEPVEETTTAPAVEATDEVATEVVEEVEIIPEEVVEAVEVPVVEVEAAATVAPVDRIKAILMKQKFTVIAVVVVAIIMLALTFVMERQGRISTGMFDGLNKVLATKTAVAKVNDNKITQYDLNISMSQIAAGAAAQGADVSKPDVQTEIQKQAIEMLVNTELLKQEAVKRDIVITDENVQTRLETLKTDVGGEEELAKRMAEFSIDEKTLLRDIKNELTIQTLLDAVFVEKNIEVTDVEVKDFYAKAKETGGKEADFPKLDAVRPQIEAQIRSTKEQGIVTAFIEELRAGASIEVLI